MNFIMREIDFYGLILYDLFSNLALFINLSLTKLIKSFEILFTQKCNFSLSNEFILLFSCVCIRIFNWNQFFY